MPDKLTPRQINFLKWTVEDNMNPYDIARHMGKKELRDIRNVVGGISETLSSICNKFAVATPEEAYDKAVAEGLIIPPRPQG